ncbi:YkgJ family cysteine cluster protein [Desulfoluna sp.]|uniref:YkgJ family cysteine cluster protein n=1 Tax=Desulfoluna sp. TaxID=2045199 RepID=UPI0026167ED1|nr:YkgJ family cysteine cluster protein [Desulfoluna sp.]
MDAEIFLTMEEAKNAVCMDLEHYGVQKEDLIEVAELAGGGWPDRFREVASVDEPSIDKVVSLVQEFLNSPTVTEEVLCGSFSIMFWGHVRKAVGPDGDEGVGLATGLHDFSCIQCGQCCTNLDYSRALTAEDVALWEQAGRHDILAWVGKDKEDGGYTIWVHPETGEPEESCPFLRFEKGKCLCTIHDIKPAICREYPATKKHGFMTDCTGVRQMVEKERAG